MVKKNIEELISNLRTLLNKEIPTEVFLFGKDTSEACAGLFQGPGMIKRAAPKEEFIFNLLGHVSANPSNDDNRKILNEIYKYPTDDLKIVDRKYANLCSTSKKDFLLRLRAASKFEAELRLERHTDPLNLIHRSVFILHGPRGAGKTFYLNHVISRGSDLLDRERCIWVRIGIMEDFGGESPDIVSWLLSKLALIVFRYYHRNSGKYIEVKEHLDDYINNIRDKALSLHFKTQLSLMERLFEGPRELTLSADIVPKELGLELSKILVDKGYSFIFVVDGLDRIESTPRFRHKFDRIIHSLSDLLSKDTIMGATYLLVLRDESLHEVKDRLNRAYTRGRIVDFEEVELKDVAFERIIRSRIKFIKHKTSSLSISQKWDFTGWGEHIEGFRRHLLNDRMVKDLVSYSSALDEVLTHNHRAKIQLLQMSYDDYLRESQSQKHYLLIERMCKGGLKYPFAPSYSVNMNGIITHTNEKIYDNILLPNVFHFPYHNDYLWKNIGHAGTPILAGLRILQLLLAYNFVHGADNKQELSCEKFASMLLKVFGYDKVLIYNLLLMFSEYELISMNGIPFVPQEVAHYKISILPKSNYIRRNIITDIAYLNMCAMRLPVNKKYLTTNPLLFACTMDDITSDEWSSKKIINAANLLRIIKKVNSLEQGKYNKIGVRGDKNAYDVIDCANRNFNLFDCYNNSVEEAIIGQMRGILERMNDTNIVEDLIIRSLNDGVATHK